MFKLQFILFPMLLIILFSSCAGKDEESSKGNNDEEQTEQPQHEEELYSDLTCPYCGFTENILMPTESCLIRHTCSNCKKEIFPKEGDCCVFCTYGTVKCPSKQ